jgi:hypothetical protein
MVAVVRQRLPDAVRSALLRSTLRTMADRKEGAVAKAKHHIDRVLSDLATSSAGHAVHG